MIVEQIVERVSKRLQVPSMEVRELNMYHEGDTALCGMLLTNCNIGRCWEQLKESSDFASRRAAVDKFNQCVNAVREIDGITNLVNLTNQVC